MKVKEFFVRVSSDTIDHSYEELIRILLSYEMFLSIEREVFMDIWREEVIWEVLNRLAGHCAPHKAIDFLIYRMLLIKC